MAGSGGSLGSQLLKVQDTIPICVSGLSQAVALGALSGGAAHVANNIAALSPNKAALLDALSPLGSPGGLGSVAGGEGAIYFFAKLPSGRTDDEAVVEWLVNEHGVCLIPGSSCGAPGYVRAAFANLTPERCQLAAGRLKAGLKQLVEVAPGGPLPRSSAAGRL